MAAYSRAEVANLCQRTAGLDIVGILTQNHDNENSSE